MVSFIAGDCILNTPQNMTVWDEQTNSYKFFHTYKSYIPLENLTGLSTTIYQTATQEPKLNEIVEMRVIAAEIWLSVHSPAQPFKDKSLVYMRGRMIMPSTEHDDGEDVFVLYIEAFYIHLRTVVLSDRWTLQHVLENVPPHPEIIGKVIELKRNRDRVLTLLIESDDDVDVGVEKTRVG